MIVKAHVPLAVLREDQAERKLQQSLCSAARAVQEQVCFWSPYFELHSAWPVQSEHRSSFRLFRRLRPEEKYLAMV